ncbi:DUF3784 domain-containing protein [Priestia taiwanensis]|uniref:Membrane protein n=1 Tax=Priestia taiwanensis TaxID=1347902 RepID=A0A917AKF6_9BACI|nr:DUF3784 domain-containing protein [Priestia taiwanensis]MBM7362033.1 preprotein translocase subunit SecG [Priestia taiwanensis]GGE58930.1 membrane protein [Priestia taiwanensis]
MEAAVLIIAIPFLIFAIILSRGKGAFLLAGYNTMSDEEKAQYDEVALCKFMGKIMYGISFNIVLFAISQMLENQLLLIIAIILFAILLIFTFVYPNTGNRFKKKVK